ITAARRRAIAHLHHHHVPGLRESARAHLEAWRAKPSECAEHRHEIRREAREPRHGVPDPHDLRSETEADAVHEVLAADQPGVEPRRPGGDEPLHGAHRAVPVHARALREIVPGADPHYTERDLSTTPVTQPPVRRIRHGAVAAYGHDAL